MKKRCEEEGERIEACKLLFSPLQLVNNWYFLFGREDEEKKTGKRDNEGKEGKRQRNEGSRKGP